MMLLPHRLCGCTATFSVHRQPHTFPSSWHCRAFAQLPRIVSVRDENFGHSVSVEEVSGALKVLATEWRALDKIAGHMLDGLLSTAAKAELDDIPADLLLACLTESIPSHVFYEESVLALVRSRPSLFRKLYAEAMQELPRDMASRLWHRADLFAELGGEALLDMVPPMATMPRDSQQFISRVLYLFFAQSPSVERLEQFKAKAPGYVQDGWIPQQRSRPSGRDILNDKGTLLKAISSGKTAIEQAGHVLKAVEQIEPQGSPPARLVDRVLSVLSRHPRYVGFRILDVFRRCVADVHYVIEWRRP